MIARIENIGSPANASGPKKFRRWLNDLFGSSYTQLLERDLMQARLERDRAQTELRQVQERLIETLALTKGVPLRPIIPQAGTIAPKAAKVPLTNWQQIQAEAIAENAAAEELEAKQSAAKKEN